MAEQQIGHRKSRSVLSARFPVVIWRSRSVAKSASYPVDNAIDFPNTYLLDSDLFAE